MQSMGALMCGLGIHMMHMDITRFKCTNYPTVTCSKTLFRIKASELIMTSGNVNIEFNLARPENCVQNQYLMIHDGIDNYAAV